MLTLSDIKGVGPATLKKLCDLNINSVFEVFSFLPKKYIDLQEPVKVTDAQAGQLYLFEGRVERVSDITSFGKKSFFVAFSDNLSANKTYYKAVFYNMPFLHGSFEVGQSFRMLARLTKEKGVFCMVNPVVERVEKISKLKGVYTVYPLKNVFGQSAYKNIVYSALDSLKQLDYKGRFCTVNKDLAVCFEQAHRPSCVKDAEIALEKLATIDMAIMISLYRKTKKSVDRTRKVFYNFDKNRIVDYNNSLDFSPTASQLTAFDDISNDLLSQNYMSRVVSGDVGSGKTAVAFFAMCIASFSGHQSALMAPTEILARQHAAKFEPIARRLGINFATLTGSTDSAERKSILKGLLEGSIDCVIGTNALVSDDVVYKNLTLAVIDEQHRFGVNERSKIEKKGAVDVLSMTATPIPRSLALMFYDDISISRIKRRDEAQTNISTKLSSSVEDILKNISQSVKHGKQAFIVCPSVVDAEGNDLMSIESFVKDYARHLKDFDISVIHGKLSNDEKTKVMKDFAEGKTQILIATTVIEVGIDTKATEIAILNADRFGLASLHQLRGRIGRDGSEAHCYLHSENTSEKAVERLSVLCKSNDGQYLAEMDFSMRGAGDFIGTRQSGRSSTPIFDLQMSADVLNKAKEYADRNLSHLTQNELLALTHRSEYKVTSFIEELQSVTLNS